MLENSIHTLRFDISCNSEKDAAKANFEILNYTYAAFTEIIQGVFEKKLKTKAILKVDKIEIDLGLLSLSFLSSEPILRKFEVLLGECIEREINKNRYLLLQEDRAYTSEDSDAEIITSYLLHGDLPWWLNKNMNLDIDVIFRKTIKTNPSVILHFFEQFGNNRNVKKRVQEQLKTETISLIAELVPGLSQYNKSEVLKDFSFLPAVHGQKLKQKEDGKETYIRQILDSKTDDWLTKLNYFELSESEVINISTQTSLEDRFRAASKLEKLSLYQLVFLNPERIPRFESKYNFRNRERAIERIKNKLGIKNILFKEVINQLDVSRINYLLGAFKYIDKTERQRKMKIREIVDHPGFLKYDLFRVPGLRTMLDKLPVSLIHAYRVILENGFYEKKTDRKAVIEILNILPATSIDLLISLIYSSFEEPTILYQQASDLSDFSFPGTADRKIIIENAGLCLLAPYLPSLFRELGYLENGFFKNSGYAIRAAYLLEYLNGGRKSMPEYLLQFNKLICGIDPKKAITRYRRFTKTEISEADDLLTSIIRNWKALKNTSVNGLRTSFLQRKGILTESDVSWKLQIEKKGMDVLLDSISWSYSMIKLPWMKKMIQVEW